MKSRNVFILFLTVFAVNLTVKAQDYIKIEIPSQPATVEEFAELRDQIATSAEGGAAMFLLALKIYVENPDLGRKCLISSIDLSALSKSASGYKGYDLTQSSMSLIKRQMEQYPYVPKSYIEGSSPENKYEVSAPYKYYFKSNPYSGKREEGKFKIFVKCSGADSDRPIQCYKNDKGIWKAKEWSSVLTGIRKPQEDISDDL